MEDEYLLTDEEIENAENMMYFLFGAPKEVTDLKAKKCTCCGAPLYGKKCEYCGVEYGL